MGSDHERYQLANESLRFVITNGGHCKAACFMLVSWLYKAIVHLVWNGYLFDCEGRDVHVFCRSYHV